MNRIEKGIYLIECKPDEALVRSLTSISRKRVRHAGGKAELLKMLVTHYSNSKGMIDYDPSSVQPPQLRDFQTEKDSPSCGLKILRQATRDNLVAVLCPRLEEWIIEATREAGIDPQNHGLPNDPMVLHRQINVRLRGFEDLVKELCDESVRIQELRSFLIEDG